jgi:ferric-dicitrate binding protein FerR (iron transport regulator)
LNIFKISVILFYSLFVNSQNIIDLKNENKYWEDLVSSLEDSEKITPEQSGSDDFQWLLATTQKLKQVFYWDSFNKQSAKIKLENKLRNGNARNRISVFHTVWYRAAVVFVALISGAVIHSLIAEKPQIRYTEISVPAGQMTQIKLPDGSKVLLNSGSILKYPTVFGNSSRDVSIDGEAFMEIAKDPKKPFRVSTNRFSVEVLGTTFNITAYSNENHSDVTLVEGSVKIITDNNKKTQKIIPGESASINGGKLSDITQVNTQFYTSWKDGKIVFRKETLEEIAKKLERWYNVEIRFADEDLKNEIFSGTLLKYKPVEQVFKSLILLNKDVDFVSESRIDKKDVIYVKRRNFNNYNMK